MGWLVVGYRNGPQFVQTPNNRQPLLFSLFSYESSVLPPPLSCWFLILVEWPRWPVGQAEPGSDRAHDTDFGESLGSLSIWTHGFFELYSRFLEEGGFQFRSLPQGFPYSLAFLHEQASQEIDLDRAVFHSIASYGLDHNGKERR